jgi:hypothetical protein
VAVICGPSWHCIEIIRPQDLQGVRKSFHGKVIYVMGCQAFSDLAERARNGRDPAKYFSALLKPRLVGRMR